MAVFSVRPRGIRLLFMLVFIGASSLAACGTDAEPTLSGTDLGKHPSPGFALTDHRGQPVSLDDLRGRAVALTFIYTGCQDVCPLIAARMEAAYEQLPAETRDEVALVAITVDPERDTPEQLRQFSATHGLANNPQWFALTGDRATLAQVWQDYGIEPGDFLHETDHRSGHFDLPSDVHIRPNATPEMLSHTDAIYFIDPDGQERALLRSAADPSTIAENLKALVD